jgi:glycosyltransferase involved in cell wall biosynthesis
MNILFITAFPPNRMTAGQNYTRNLIEELSVFHDIELVYFDYPNHKCDLKGELKVNKMKLNGIKKIINCLKLPFIHPFFSARFSFRLWFYIFRNRNKFDVLYLDFSQVFVYSLFIKAKQIVLMSHDVIYQKYTRRKGFLDVFFGGLIMFWERLLLRQANKILVFSDKDAELIDQYFDLKADRVDFYIDNDITKINHYDIEITNRFCFFGAWNREENLEGLIWFIANVLPSVKESDFVILGGGMPDNLKVKISNESNIKYIGFVNNPYSVIASSQALIAPVFNGAGVKVKVLESLCCGTSVIGTNIAFEGINNLEKINADVFYCNDAGSFVDAINQFPIKKETDKIDLKNNFVYPEKMAADVLNNRKQIRTVI